MIIRTGDIIKHDNIEDKYYVYREHSEVYGTWSQIYVINNLVVEKLIKLEYLYELPPDYKHFNFGGNEFKTDITIDVDVILDDIGNGTMSKYKEKIKLEERSNKITNLDVGKRVILKPFNKEDEHEMVMIVDCVIEESRQSQRQDGPFGEPSGKYIQVEKYIVERYDGSKLVVPEDRLMRVKNTLSTELLSEKILMKLHELVKRDYSENLWWEGHTISDGNAFIGSGPNGSEYDYLGSENCEAYPGLISGKYDEYLEEIAKLIHEELK